MALKNMPTVYSNKDRTGEEINTQGRFLMPEVFDRNYVGQERFP